VLRIGVLGKPTHCWPSRCCGPPFSTPPSGIDRGWPRPLAGSMRRAERPGPGAGAAVRTAVPLVVRGQLDGTTSSWGGEEEGSTGMTTVDGARSRATSSAVARVRLLVSPLSMGGCMARADEVLVGATEDRTAVPNSAATGKVEGEAATPPSSFVAVADAVWSEPLRLRIFRFATNTITQSPAPKATTATAATETPIAASRPSAPVGAE
jgi:hypothetical protein